MSSTLKPAVVTPQEWVSRTSHAVYPRSSSLKAVDAAYDAWYKNSADLAKRKALLGSLDAFLKENGLYWNKVSRNTDSNGQMEYIHSLMKEAAGEKQHDLHARAIPHSRYGVLYLLGNLTVDVNGLNAAVEGLEKVGGIFAEGFASSLKSIPVGPGVAGKHLTGKDATSAGSAAIGGLRKGVIDTPVAQRAEHRNFIRTEDKPTAMNQYGFPITRMALQAASDHPLVAVAGAPLTLATGVVTVVADVFNNVRLAVMKAVNAVADKLRAKMLADGTWSYRMAGQAMRKIVVTAVNHIMGEVVPFLKEGVAMAHHLAETIHLTYRSIEMAWLRKDISVNPGHPELIAHAIQMQILKDAGKSFLSAAGEAVKMGLKTVVAGAGHIGAAILSAIAWLVKFICRMCEGDRIQDFLEEARRVYAVERRLAKKVVHEGTSRIEVEPNMDPRKGGYIHDVKRFKAFFQKGCDASSVIPMLTLNSGICGSLMTLMQMYQGDASNAQVIEQKTFDKGNEYFSLLKAMSARYMRSKGFKFSSQDPAVSGYLVHALRDHQMRENALVKTLAFI